MRISDWSSDVCSSDLVEQLVARAALDAGSLRVEGAVVVFGHGLDIGRFALVFKEGDDGFDFLVGNEGPVDAGDTAAAGHVQHVALAEKLLGALLAEDGAAVDPRGDLEADARREVRLDRAGDDVDRGALRRQDRKSTRMNAS